MNRETDSSGFSVDKLHGMLASKEIVDVMLAQDAWYTGNTWLVTNPWAYAGGVLVGMDFRNRPADNMNPSAVTFRKPKAAKHVIIVYKLQQQLWRQTMKGVQLGLYESGIRTKTVHFPVAGRGYGDLFGFVKIENVNVQEGNELRLQMDGEDMPNNRQTGTPKWTELGIDYVILYNDK